jgi:molybdopterin-binding protein
MRPVPDCRSNSWLAISSSAEASQTIMGQNRQSSRHPTLVMTLSARNQLEGIVEDIKLGGVMAHVTVRVGNNLVESVITVRSVEEMKLRTGDKVKAVIKSTEVMLSKD